jgi:hypothetical protein
MWSYLLLTLFQVTSIIFQLSLTSDSDVPQELIFKGLLIYQLPLFRPVSRFPSFSILKIYGYILKIYGYILKICEIL